MVSPPACAAVQSEIRKLLEGLGEDTRRSGLLDTPKRVAKAYVDATVGYSNTVAGVVGSAVFDEPLVTRGSGGLVLVRNIDFSGTCDATLMPFHGQCHIAYIPAQDMVLGLSKLARVVDVLSKRVTNQQSLVDGLADAVCAHMPCKGVMAVCCARHLADVHTRAALTTCAATGCFLKEGSSEREEVTLLLQLLGVDLQLGLPRACSAAPLLPSLPASSSQPRKAPMVAAVREIYARVLPAGERVSAAAAAAYVDTMVQQTIGYRSTLQDIVKKHAAASSGAVSTAADAADAEESVSNQTALGRSGGRTASTSTQASCSSMDCSDSDSEAPSVSNALLLWASHCGGRVQRASIQLPGVPAAAVWQVAFASQCEHHLLPFYGRLFIVIAGPSQPGPALVRDVVDLFTCRLQIQERITHEVVDALSAVVPECGGVAVVCDAAHMCMVARGVEKHASSTITTAARGLFTEHSGLLSSTLRLLVLGSRPGCPIV